MSRTQSTVRSTSSTVDASIGVLYAGYLSTHQVATDDAHPETTPLPIYDLPDHDLTSLDGLVVPSVVDQKFLAHESEVFADYLDAGGVIVSFAKMFRDWLTGYCWHSHPTSARALELELAYDHPVFEPVTERDLNLYEGVSGWFTRGYLEPPAGAKPIVVDAEDRVIVSVDEESTPGTILATAGSDLFHTAFRDHEPFPKVVARLLDWVTDVSAVSDGEQGERHEW